MPEIRRELRTDQQTGGHYGVCVTRKTDRMPAVGYRPRRGLRQAIILCVAALAVIIALLAS